MVEPKFSPEDTVEFFNISDRDFVCKFNGAPYNIPAKSSKSVRLPVAQHFAKHLADAILQVEYDLQAKKDKDPQRRKRALLWMDPKRPAMYAQMIPTLAEELKKMEEPAKKKAAELEAREGLQPPPPPEPKPVVSPSVSSPDTGSSTGSPDVVTKSPEAGTTIPDMGTQSTPTGTQSK